MTDGGEAIRSSVLLGAGVAMQHKNVSTFTDIYADLLRKASQGAPRQMETFLARPSDATKPTTTGQMRGQPRKRA